jgi:hypothetical protein
MRTVCILSSVLALLGTVQSTQNLHMSALDMAKTAEGIFYGLL